MIVYGRFSLDEVLPFVSNENYSPEGKIKRNFNGFNVKLSSARLFLFKKSLKCVTCDRVGSYFLLEAQDENTTPHLNLYSQDDVLMTKDHIIPKSRGGLNHRDNYQTMCTICNCEKGNTI